MELTFFWELLKSVGALWLGAYALTRGGWYGRAQMAATALILWSLSPFSVAMMAVSDDQSVQFWLRFLIGVWPLTIGFLFGTSMSLVSDSLSDVWRPRLRTVYQLVIVAGVVLGCFGAFSNLVYVYESAQWVSGQWLDGSFAATGSAEPVYRLYQLVIPLLLVVIMTWAVLQTRQSQQPHVMGMRYVMAAGWVWMLGLLLRRIVYSGQLVRDGFLFNNLVDPVFVLAIALFGGGMVQHNAIMRGRVVMRDFLLSLAGLLLIVFGFGFLPWALASTLYPFESPLGYFLLLMMTWIAVWTHMLIEMARQRVDIVLVGDTAATVREEVADVMQANLQGLPLEETFDELELIRKKALIRESVNKQLLRALNSAEGQTQLASSALQTLRVVQAQLPEHATERQKASAILTLLEQSLVVLTSADKVAPSARQQELLQILTLRLKDGLDRADITQRLHVHPRKYDRLLTDGVAQLADVIFELELAANATD